MKMTQHQEETRAFIELYLVPVGPNPRHGLQASFMSKPPTMFEFFTAKPLFIDKATVKAKEEDHVA